MAVVLGVFVLKGKIIKQPNHITLLTSPKSCIHLSNIYFLYQVKVILQCKIMFSWPFFPHQKIKQNTLNILMLLIHILINAFIYKDGLCILLTVHAR